jgi:hypothetical protein
MTSELVDIASEEALRRGIWSEADAVDENCDFSSQRHFNARTLCEAEHYGLGMGAVALAAVAAGASLLAPNFNHWLVGGLAAASAALTGISTLLKPKERFAEHARAGDEYLSLRNAARTFKRLDFVNPESGIFELVAHARELTDRMDRLNKSHSMLTTPWRAYLRAKQDIARGRTRNRGDARRQASSNSETR